MHPVINRLPLQKTTNWFVLARTGSAFETVLRTEYPRFSGCTVIQEPADASILAITFETSSKGSDSLVVGLPSV